MITVRILSYFDGISSGYCLVNTGTLEVEGNLVALWLITRGKYLEIFNYCSSSESIKKKILTRFINKSAGLNCMCTEILIS